jgi:hypothetical protein
LSAEPQKNRRSHRAHGAVDRLPEEVRMQIVDWWLGRPEDNPPIPRLTLDEIADALVKLGYKINRNQVWRWIARQRNDLNRMEKYMAKAKSLAKYLVPEGSTIESAVVTLANALCLEALSGADLQQVKSIQDLVMVAHAAGTLQRSAVTREKWEHEEHKKNEAALAELKAEVQELLRGKPELTGKLLDVIDAAGEKILEKKA